MEVDWETEDGRYLESEHPDGGEMGGGVRRLFELVATSLDSEDSDEDDDEANSGASRVYRLHNRCSMRFMRIAGTRIDATASDEDIYSA